jgi:hypothetical protein
VSDLLLGVDGRVLWQCMLNKYNVKVWAAFMFRIGFSGCLLCMQQWLFGFHRNGEISSLAGGFSRKTSAFCWFVCLSVG